MAKTAKSDPLQAILDFVARVTSAGGPDFVPPNERIAVFDNDGTLWCEIPIPVQALFADDRLRAMAPQSDGDREMLMWTTRGRPDGRRAFGLLVHHTDGEREFAYDRQPVLSGQLDKGLDEASRYGWLLADMKKDWKTVFVA